MIRLQIMFQRALLWAMRSELAIGESTGMNRSDLNALRTDIMRAETDLAILEMNHV